jgi:murein DD-endopeptidase MepM/ murein hydrolase activator NlpD
MYKFFKRARSIIIFILAVILFLTNIFIMLGIPKANAAAIQTYTVSFETSTARSRSKTVYIPNLKRITSIKSNTGSVSYSISGDNVTVNVNNGAAVDSYTPSSYITYTDSRTTTSSSPPSFSNTYYYNSGGYSGTLSKSGSVSTSQTQYALYQYSQKYAGTLYGPTQSQYQTYTSSYESSSSSPSFSSTYYYSSGGYSGTLTKSGSASTYTVQTAGSKYASVSAGEMDRVDYERWNGTAWVWYATLPPTGPESYYYTDSQGYSGTLWRKTVEKTWKWDDPPPPQPWYVGQTTTVGHYHYRYEYQGTVSRPAIYRHSQTYSGYVYYTPSSYKTYYEYQTTSSTTAPSFPSSVYYSDGYYSGSLPRSGSPTRTTLQTDQWTHSQTYSGTVTGPTTYYYAYEVTIQYELDDIEPPIITANPVSKDWDTNSATVTLTYSDSGSGIATKQYAWSTSTTAPTTWSNYTGPVTQSSIGEWYLHARATDIAGNTATKYFGPYRINELLSITLEPAEAAIVKTETLPLTVKAKYYNGDELDVTSGSAYSSSDASIASVTPQGAVTGNKVGQAVITAVYNGKMAQSAITVQEPETTVSGNITITKTPTYVYTKWHKDTDGNPAQMDIKIEWTDLKMLVLRADDTVLRSEPITLTKAESQHLIDRYTVFQSYSDGDLIEEHLTNTAPGSGYYQATYQYDKAGKETSPFTFTGYYNDGMGQEKTFKIRTEIPVNGISTSLFSIKKTTSGSTFLRAFTNTENGNIWRYNGVWPAASAGNGILDLSGAGSDMLWPLSGHASISSYFGRRVDPINGKITTHHGIDIPAPEGTPIASPVAGTVVYAGQDEAYGNMLVIRSGKYDFLFGHCSSLLASTGQPVAKGQTIAKIGNTGRSTGPHLHLGVSVGPYTQGNYIDPLTVVKP